MTTLPDNGARGKRFRELKATRRTNRQRLRVGIDGAQAEHVVHLRHAPTRVVVPRLTIPNTTRGFTQLWARIQQAQRSTGCREVVVGREPTGTYHQAGAECLAAQGGDLLLLSRSVAYWNRRTQDGTWGKHDRKDAVHGADLLEQGKGLLYSQPTGPLAALRHLVKWLPGPHRARRLQGPLADDAPAGLPPMGAALPQRRWAEWPAVSQVWEQAAPGRPLRRVQGDRGVGGDATPAGAGRVAAWGAV